MKRIAILMLAMAMGLVGIQQVRSTDMTTSNNAISIPDGAKTAVFAGGCFWCTESDFEKVDGVIEAVSGYTGGRMANPTYEQVSRGATSHIESVMVVYDPAKLSYRELLDIFWRHVDPTDGGGQFVDRGGQYRSAIFYADNRQKQAAEASKRNLAKSGVFTKAVATEIVPLGEFYPAEDYHQDYYKKNPWRYKFYRSGSGRDRFLKNAWADHPVKEKKMSMSMTPAEKDQPYTIPSDAQLRSTLTQQQYYVVRENGTERPFNNEFWDNKAEGIYVDIVSGEPLFSSTDKYKSGTGWPSFVRPLVANNIVEKKDRTLFMVRVEVRSKHADSHLGHVFDDGPAPTGKRYCINSAALRFVPKAELDANGYGEFAKLFASN